MKRDHTSAVPGCPLRRAGAVIAFFIAMAGGLHTPLPAIGAEPDAAREAEREHRSREERAERRDAIDQHRQKERTRQERIERQRENHARDYHKTMEDLRKDWEN